MVWPKAVPRTARDTLPAHEQVRDSGCASIPYVRFTDITRQAGITFRHENSAIGRKLLPETMGGGCAFFDFDNDGDQDLLLVNSLRRWPWDRKSTDPPEATMGLYRNDGQGNFEDVTAGSGLDVSFYGMGAAVGDYDGDGLADVFLSAVGTNRLFHNEGNGKFRNVTAEAGDVRRFDSQRKATPYAGLAPGIGESAGKARQLGITKGGSRLLRTTLVESAWRLVVNTRRWARMYEKLRTRCGAKKAIVAVARRLWCVMVSMFGSGQKCQPT